MCDKKMKKPHLFKYNIGEVCEKMRIFEALKTISNPINL